MKSILSILLAGILMVSPSFGQNAKTAESTTTPFTITQEPEQKIRVVVTTGSVNSEATRATALAAEVTKTLKAFHDLTVEENTNISKDDAETLNFRFLAKADPNDAKNSLVTVVLVIHVKGQMYSVYLGATMEKLTPETDLAEYAGYIIQGAEELYADYKTVSVEPEPEKKQ